MSVVFLESIEGDPESALGNALGYAQNLAVGETSQSSYADLCCQHVCACSSCGALREHILHILVAALPGFPCAWKPQAWLWRKARGIWIKLVLIL